MHPTPALCQILLLLGGGVTSGNYFLMEGGETNKSEVFKLAAGEYEG